MLSTASHLLSNLSGLFMSGVLHFRCIPPRQQHSRSWLLFLYSQLQFLNVPSLLGCWRKRGGSACWSAAAAPQHGTIAHYLFTNFCLLCCLSSCISSVYCILIVRCAHCRFTGEEVCFWLFFENSGRHHDRSDRGNSITTVCTKHCNLKCMPISVK